MLQGMGDGGALEACVPPCPGGGGEGGRPGGGAVGRCVTCCKATRGVPMSWGPWGGVSGAWGGLSFSHSSLRYRAWRSRGTRAFRASFKS